MTGPRDSLRLALYALALIVVLAIVLTGMSWCADRDRLKRAKSEASIATATGKALDQVASQTPAIRQDQEEKQRAVDELQGADQRLPDGFGADLERVRRGARKSDDPR